MCIRDRSATLSLGDAPQVLYNEVWATGYLQSDGAVVQMMQEEQTDANIAYNWIHDTDKYGIRMDGPIGGSNNGRNATVHHNVLWNVSGALMVKGDYHEATNNTVFGDDGGKNHIIVLYENGAGNENSVIWNNAADSIAAHRANDIWNNPLQDDTFGMNWNGYMHGYANSLAVYKEHTCAILANDSLSCWGNNANGRLGIGNTINQNTPQHVNFGSGVKVQSLAKGSSLSTHSCAILDTGALYCWGYNAVGQLGIGNSVDQTTPQFVNLGAGRTALQVTTGYTHSCAILDGGSVSCWGANTYDQLGIESSIAKSELPVNVDLGSGRTAIDIASAHIHTCALLDDGTVKCWGYNHYGQMGLGNTTNTIDPPLTIPLDSNRLVSSIGIGKHHTCITFDNGSMSCTGRNNYRQLGVGNVGDIDSFQYINSLNDYSIKSSLGSYESCTLLVNGEIQCWGRNNAGQIGDGTQIQRNFPTNVNLPAGNYAAALAVGGSNSCAYLDTGSTVCWGANGHGQLGLGDNSNRNTPTEIVGLGNLANISVQDMLVDPDNRDFRPKWASQLHVIGAGAYDADDSSPWVPGIKWSYTPLSSPTVGCTHDGALNYDNNAEFEDGSCYYITIDPSATSAELSATIPMTPITVTATTSYVTNSSSQPFDYSFAGVSVHRDSDIAIDRNGKSHICFQTDDNSGDLFYMTDVTGAWNWEGVHISGSVSVGLECNIAIDSNDNIHIVYLQATSMNVKHATRAISVDGSVSGDNTWTKSNVATLPEIGSFISMDIADDDTLLSLIHI